MESCVIVFPIFVGILIVTFLIMRFIVNPRLDAMHQRDLEYIRGLSIGAMYELHYFRIHGKMPPKDSYPKEEE
jgi:hypothetical protein